MLGKRKTKARKNLALYKKNIGRADKKLKVDYLDSAVVKV